MPVKPGPGEDKNKFISRCIAHEVGKGHKQDQAAAICYGYWKDNMSIRKPKIIFSKDISDWVIKQFTEEFEVRIWSGSKYYSPSRPAFKLARMSGVNLNFVHFGEIKNIMENDGYLMFITNEDKYKDLDGYCHFDTNMNFKDMKLATIQEKWVAHDDDRTCPICSELDRIGWVDRGATFQYQWDGKSKPVQGLPPYRQSHSVIGEGEWKVDDSKCRCSKQFRVAPGSLSKDPIIVNLTLCKGH